MTRPIVFLPAADDDVMEAYRYYEAAKEELGEESLEELGAVKNRVHDNPYLYAVWRRGVRTALLRRFP